MHVLSRMIFSTLLLVATLNVYCQTRSMPQCFKNSRQNHLVSAFYYDGSFVTPLSNLTPYTEAVKHLDVLNYSTALLGLVRKDDHFQLAEITQQNLITLKKWFETNHIQTRLFISLGHWSPRRMRDIFKNDEIRDKFIQSIIEVLKNPNYNISGVDFDWENLASPDIKEIERFPHFFKALREALEREHLNNICVTLDLPTYFTYAKRFPQPKNWIDSIDWINLMGYAFYLGTTRYTELDAALGDVTLPYPETPPTYTSPVSLAGTLSYYEQKGINPRKMVIAIPFYSNVSYIHHADKEHQYGLHQPVVDHKAAFNYSYSKIYSLYGNYSHPNKNATFHQYTFTTPEISQNKHVFWLTHFINESKPVGKIYTFISYPDPIAVKEVARFVKAENYLGMSAWQLLHDLPYTNPQSLLRIMEETLKK